LPWHPIFNMNYAWRPLTMTARVSLLFGTPSTSLTLSSSISTLLFLVRYSRVATDIDSLFFHCRICSYCTDEGHYFLAPSLGLLTWILVTPLANTLSFLILFSHWTRLVSPSHVIPS
jgi:hypothetical protein